MVMVALGEVLLFRQSRPGISSWPPSVICHEECDLSSKHCVCVHSVRGSMTGPLKVTRGMWYDSLLSFQNPSILKNAYNGWSPILLTSYHTEQHLLTPVDTYTRCLRTRGREVVGVHFEPFILTTSRNTVQTVRSWVIAHLTETKNHNLYLIIPNT